MKLFRIEIPVSSDRTETVFAAIFSDDVIPDNIASMLLAGKPVQCVLYLA